MPRADRGSQAKRNLAKSGTSKHFSAERAVHLKRSPTQHGEYSRTSNDRENVQNAPNFAPILAQNVQNSAVGLENATQSERKTRKPIDFEVLDASGLIGDSTSKDEQKERISPALWSPKDNFATKLQSNLNAEGTQSQSYQTIEIANDAATKGASDYSDIDVRLSDEELQVLDSCEFPMLTASKLIAQKIKFRKSASVAKRNGDKTKELMLAQEMAKIDEKVKTLIVANPADFPKGAPTENEVTNFAQKYLPMRKSKKGGADE